MDSKSQISEDEGSRHSGDSGLSSDQIGEGFTKLNTSSVRILHHFSGVRWPKTMLVVFLFHYLQMLSFAFSPILNSWDAADPIVNYFHEIATFSFERLSIAGSVGVMISLFVVMAIVMLVYFWEANRLLSNVPHRRVSFGVQLFLIVFPVFFFPIAKLGISFLNCTLGKFTYYPSESCLGGASIAYMVFAILTLVILVATSFLAIPVMYEWSPKENKIFAGRPLIWSFIFVAKLLMLISQQLFSSILATEAAALAFGLTGCVIWAALFVRMLYSLPFYNRATNRWTLVFFSIGFSATICRTVPSLMHQPSLAGVYAFFPVAIVLGLASFAVELFWVRSIKKKLQAIRTDLSALKEICNEQDMEIVLPDFLQDSSAEGTSPSKITNPFRNIPSKCNCVSLVGVHSILAIGSHCYGRHFPTENFSSNCPHEVHHSDAANRVRFQRVSTSYEFQYLSFRLSQELLFSGEGQDDEISKKLRVTFRQQRQCAHAIASFWKNLYNETDLSNLLDGVGTIETLEQKADQTFSMVTSSQAKIFTVAAFVSISKIPDCAAFLCQLFDSHQGGFRKSRSASSRSRFDGR